MGNDKWDRQLSKTTMPIIKGLACAPCIKFRLVLATKTEYVYVRATAEHSHKINEPHVAVLHRPTYLDGQLGELRKSQENGEMIDSCLGFITWPSTASMIRCQREFGPAAESQELLRSIR